MAVATPSAAQQSIVSILSQRVYDGPHTVVYRFALETDQGQQARELAYGELDNRARRIATALKKLSPQSKAAILLYPPGSNFIASFFGCLYAGVIAVPAATPRLQNDGEGLRALASDAGASVVLTTSSIISRLERQDDWDRGGLRLMELDHREFEPQTEIAQPGAEDLAYLQYTSGSTAEPKGVMITHGNVLANLEFIQQDFQHDRESVLVTWLPHFHDMGLVYGLLQPLYNGFLSIVMSPAEFAKAPLKWLEAISINRATHSGGPNFAYDLCARKIPPESRNNLDLSSWRVAFNGAENVRGETMNRFSEAFAPCGFHRSAFYPAYGLAEATLKVSGGFIEQSSIKELNLEQSQKKSGWKEAAGARQNLVSCGRTGPATRVLVVDPQTKTQVADHETGEVWVHGPSVGKGYWDRPAETERTFQAFLQDTGEGPFLRTGDLGMFVAGELFIAGRLKDMIIVYGENHYPQDIEATVANTSPDLREQLLCAFAIASEGRERAVAACEINRRKDSADLEALAACIRAGVAEKHGIQLDSVCFVRVGTLPRTSSGKLQRSRAQQQYVSGKLPMIHESRHAETGESTAAGGELETATAQLLRETLSQVLGRPVSARESRLPLNTLGIDSLQGQELRARIERQFAQEFSLEQLMGGITLAELAPQLEMKRPERTVSEPACSQAANTDDALLPLSPEQDRFWYTHKLAPQSSAHNVAVAFRVKGALNSGAWRAAVAESERRYEALRSSFGDKKGKAWCRIRPARTEVVQYVDLTESGEQKPEIEARKTIESEAGRPFNLEEDYLLRAMVVRITEHEHIVSFVLHHIIFDIWSLQIFVRDVIQLYQAIAQESPVSPASLSLDHSYAGYVTEVWDWLKSPTAAADEAFWKTKLTPVPPQVRLPYDKERGGRRSYKAGELKFQIRGTLLQNLEQLARSEGVTSFVVLLAGLRAMFFAMNRDLDVVIGAPAANRTPKYRDSVGLFAHPVPIRLRLSAGETFKQFIKSASAEVLSALDHQQLPFGKVVEITAPARVAGDMPLMNVMFGFHGPILQSSDSSGLQIERFEISRTGTDFDLFFDVENARESLNVSLAYDADVFLPETVKALVSGYLAVLNQAVSDPTRALSSIALPKSLADKPIPAKPTEDLKVAVAATFVTESLVETFEWWCTQLRLPISFKFAPFSQLAQQLVDPGSLLRTNFSGINILLLRMSDLHDEQFAGTVVALLEEAVRTNPVLHLVYACPSAAGNTNGPHWQSSDAERGLTEQLRRIPHVETITPGQLLSLYPVNEWSDPIADRIASIPYTAEFFAGLATHMLRRTLVAARKPVKLLAIDCDQTLWQGICGEDGAAKVEVTAGHRGLQELLLERQKHGMLLCLCSKNNETDVEEVFQTNPGMLLKSEDFAAKRINWQPKSENLRDLAKGFGFALESCVLIDDDPRECGEVAANCSRAANICLPNNAARYRNFLEHHWLLDIARTTKESLNRTLSYKQNRQREEQRKSFSDLKSYIESLDVRTQFQTIDATNAERASELTHRTTQFNTTGMRWTAGQLQAEAGAGRLQAVLAEVEDRYGKYGIVGLMVLRPSEKVLTLELLALSCRALGRGVEDRIIAEALRLAKESGHEHLDVMFKRTNRNTPAFDFLRRIVFEKQDVHQGAQHHLLQTSRPIEYNLPHSAGSADDNRQQDAEMISDTGDRFSIPMDQLNWIANHLSNAAVILEKAQTATRIGRSTALSPASPAATATEKAVAAVWEEVLKVEQVGRLDDFFELGGHSMKAVQVLARLQEKFGLELTLDVMFQGSPTVEQIARIIDEQLPQPGHQAATP